MGLLVLFLEQLEDTPGQDLRALNRIQSVIKASRLGPSFGTPQPVTIIAVRKSLICWHETIDLGLIIGQDRPAAPPGRP